METKDQKKNLVKFIIPSLIGVMLFVCPIPTEDGANIAIAILASAFSDFAIPVMPFLVYTLIFASAIGTIITKLFKPAFILNNKNLNNLFNITLLWAVIRVLGAVIALLVLLQVGPEWLISADTGQFIFYELLLYWIGTILIAGSLMDFLLNYGFMEFIGTFTTKIMRPIYKLPGRCAIDCLASWLGDAVVGILITTDQYTTGYYSKREAAVIASTFSAVSISFTLIVCGQLDLMHMFLPFFLVTFGTGLIVAIIMPRIWPLSKFDDSYCIEGVVIPEDEKRNLMKMALAAATERASKSTFSVKDFIIKGVRTAVECAMICMPTVMVIGTLSLALSYYTPVFTWLGVPFEPILNLLQVPEAAAASECILAGFGDMFIPSVLASSTITSEFTKFFIGVLSITQLIYMSEVGGLLISTKLPLKFLDVLVIFLERTILCIPVILLLMNLFVF